MTPPTPPTRTKKPASPPRARPKQPSKRAFRPIYAVAAVPLLLLLVLATRDPRRLGVANRVDFPSDFESIQYLPLAAGLVGDDQYLVYGMPYGLIQHMGRPGDWTTHPDFSAHLQNATIHFLNLGDTMMAVYVGGSSRFPHLDEQISTDGGQTWAHGATAKLPEEEGETRSFSPPVLMSAAAGGKAIATATKSVGTSFGCNLGTDGCRSWTHEDISFRAQDVTGASWSGVVVVKGTLPRIALDARDHLHFLLEASSGGAQGFICGSTDDNNKVTARFIQAADYSASLRAIEPARKGLLLTYLRPRGSASDPSDLVFTQSLDGGKTWSKPLAIDKTGARFSSTHVAGWEKGIIVTAVRDGQSVWYDSGDAGRSWSAPKALARDWVPDFVYMGRKSVLIAKQPEMNGFRGGGSRNGVMVGRWH